MGMGTGTVLRYWYWYRRVWYGMVSHLYLLIVLGAREPWNPIAPIAVRCHQVSEASCSVKRPFLEAFGGNPAMKRFVL